jgi:hypothetical protein
VKLPAVESGRRDAGEEGRLYQGLETTTLSRVAAFDDHLSIKSCRLQKSTGLIIEPLRRNIGCGGQGIPRLLIHVCGARRLPRVTYELCGYCNQACPITYGDIWGIVSFKGCRVNGHIL